MAKKKTEVVEPLAAAAPKIKQAPIQRVHRSQIREAPYNPRFMNDEAREKLRGALNEFGLVETLVWNQRTGNLVGGHQRISELDAANGENYEIDVSVVDLDDVQERRLNIVLNNGAIQGDWDLPKMEHMFRHDGVDPFSVGLDVPDLAEMFPADVIEEFIEQYYPDDDAGELATELPGTPDEASIEDTADEIAKIKEARKDHKAADGEALRSDHMIVLVFKKPAQAEAVLRQFKLPPTEPFVFADRFFSSVRGVLDEQLAGVEDFSLSTAMPVIDSLLSVPEE